MGINMDWLILNDIIDWISIHRPIVQSEGINQGGRLVLTMPIIEGNTVYNIKYAYTLRNGMLVRFTEDISFNGVVDGTGDIIDMIEPDAFTKIHGAIDKWIERAKKYTLILESDYL